MVDVEDLKERFLDLEFDTTEFEISTEKIVEVAKATQEPLPQFSDPGHADFQAPPAVIASLASNRRLPIDFPSLGGIPMDGGKAVACHQPVPADTPLTGKTHLHDIYDKSGRSGRMVFLVSRMEIYNQAGDKLATSDSRMVIREKPDA